MEYLLVKAPFINWLIYIEVIEDNLALAILEGTVLDHLPLHYYPTPTQHIPNSICVLIIE